MGAWLIHLSEEVSLRKEKPAHDTCLNSSALQHFWKILKRSFEFLRSWAEESSQAGYQAPRIPLCTSNFSLAVLTDFTESTFRKLLQKIVDIIIMSVRPETYCVSDCKDIVTAGLFL